MQYSAAIAAALSNLPDRILSLLPQVADDIAAKIRAEAEEVQRAAQQINPDALAS
jgi:predicted phosphoribosyltransferase